MAKRTHLTQEQPLELARRVHGPDSEALQRKCIERLFARWCVSCKWRWVKRRKKNKMRTESDRAAEVDSDHESRP